MEGNSKSTFRYDVSLKNRTAQKQHYALTSKATLYSELTMILLTPSKRFLGGFLTADQVYGAIPSPLPLGQSLLLIWPQITGLIAATLICFAISYYLFMREEIRA